MITKLSHFNRLHDLFDAFLEMREDHAIKPLTGYLFDFLSGRSGRVLTFRGLMMKTLSVALVALPLALSLSACGDTWGERAVTGGGIGAGTGLAVGAIAGWPLVAPVLVGTAVGAGIGAATTPKK